MERTRSCHKVANYVDSADLRLQLRELFGRKFKPGTNGVIGTLSPRGSSDLRKLMLCTRESGVPVVPRGAATSPYGGATASQGVVVSLDRMNYILNIDEHAELATVEPGVTWQELIDELRPRGLMPRVFPSSVAISTIGGFVAQGGVGVGSFQYGDVGATVHSVRMMTVDGEIVELSGDSLELAIGVEGRTGILVEITLRLQSLAPMEAVSAIFNRVEDLERGLAEIARSALPLWSVSMMDRAAVELQRRQQPAAFDLPHGRYAALFSFRARDRLLVLPKLRGGILAAGGNTISAPGPHERWIKRFMGLQSLGTTPIPLQFRIPLAKLRALVDSMPPELRDAVAFEGVLADVPSCITVRFFFFEPPRSRAQNLQLARKLLSLVKKLGGQAYATGLYFTEEAEAIFGAERLEKLLAFHEAADPGDRLNPGKAFLASPAVS